MKYPDKFVVESKTTDYVWDAVRVEGTDTWSWQERNTDTPIGPYTAATMNSWQDSCKFIFPEPELVFPFTFRTEYPYEDNDTYVAVESAKDDSRIELHSKFGIGNISKENGKMLIKDGKWIVTSVGDTITDTERMVRTLKAPTSGEAAKFYSSLKVREAPTSPSVDISTLTLKVDATLPTESFKAFAEAIESVNIALESMQKIMGEMGLGGHACEAVVDTIDWNTVQAQSFGTYKGNQ